MQGLGVKDWYRPRSPHSYSLQVLRTHDRPRAGMRCLSATVVRNASVAHQALACRAYARHTRTMPKARFDLMLCRGCAQT